MAKVYYRAVHNISPWRKVNSHKNLQNAIEGKDGAAGLFARPVRIDYSKHGDPLYVFVWEDGADHGWMVWQREDGIDRKRLPLHLILNLERNNGGNKSDFDKLMNRSE